MPDTRWLLSPSRTLLPAMRCAALLLVPVVAGGFGTAAAGARNPARIVLSGPEVFKVDWNTRDLTVCDLNRDGLPDLAVLNNDRAKIELLIQRSAQDLDGQTSAGSGQDERSEDRAASPERSAVAQDAPRIWEPILDDARFQKHSIVSGITMYALAVGDLNGDSRPDLAYTGKPDALTIRLQAPTGTWEQKQVVELDEPVSFASSLEIVDIDRDGRQDLVLLGAEKIVILNQNVSGTLNAPRAYPLSESRCHGLLVQDIDNDGRLDLLYLRDNDQAPVRFRLQEPGGGFGPEIALRADPYRGDLHPIRLAGIDGNCFAAIEEKTDFVELFRFQPRTDRGQAGSELQPRVYAIEGSGRPGACYTLGDFDGDGRTDLAAGDGQNAQVWLYRQRPEGGFLTAASYPALSDLRGLAAADLDGDGRDELVMTSPQEGTVGFAHLLADKRLEFPKPLPIAGSPLATAVGDLNGDGLPEIVTVRKQENERQVAILSRASPSQPWQEQSVTLAGLRTNPMALSIMDIDQDGRPDIAVFTVQNPLRFLIQQSSGDFQEVTPQSGFQAGLVDNIDPSAATLYDTDGDGRRELLIAGKGYARALRMSPDHLLEIVEQFNASGGAEVAAALQVDLDGDGKQEMLLCELGGEDVQVLRRDEQGVYRHQKSLALGKIQLVDSRVMDLDGNGKPDILLCGRDRFWWIPIGASELGREILGTYETEIPEHVYSDLATGDLDGDGQDELITLDATDSRILEVLVRQNAAAGSERQRSNPRRGGGKGAAGDNGAANRGGVADGRDHLNWESVLHFPVFEENIHYSGRQGGVREPREILVTDATGDGRPDVLLLVHDRVLLYPSD